MDNHFFQLASKLITRPYLAFQLLLRVIRASHRVVPIYNPKYARVFSRAIRLMLKEGFIPEESFQLGLLDPGSSMADLDRFVSKRRLIKIQLSINPSSWRFLMDDKAIFYSYCNALGVSTPKVYAIFNKETAGCTSNGSILKTGEDWKSFFEGEAPSEFVIKPARGVYGLGINLYSRAVDGFKDASGKHFTSEDLYRTMFRNSTYDSFVVQERLRNHPAIIQLTETQYLQTLRMTTFISKKGGFHVLDAHFKLIMGDNIVDNLHGGLTGNLGVPVSLNNGTLCLAIKMFPDRPGIAIIRHHARTGVPIEGFPLPLWDETCALIKNAAFKFLPIRTVGWDVGLTPSGPYVVEANPHWDPPNELRSMGEVMSAIFKEQSM